jgi:hypothetical protein
MAHSCPECGSTCYCGGDIDDCLFDFEEDVISCTHWKQCDREELDDDWIFGPDVKSP